MYAKYAHMAKNPAQNITIKIRVTNAGNKMNRPMTTKKTMIVSP